MATTTLEAVLNLQQPNIVVFTALRFTLKTLQNQYVGMATNQD